MATPYSYNRQLTLLVSYIGIFISGSFIHYYATNYTSLTGWSLYYANMVYSIFDYVITVTIISSIIGMSFREIREYAKGGHILLGKFIPVMRFLSISLVWVIGGILLLHHLGIDTTQLITGAGIGGVIFALASKDIFSNLIGSLSIILSRMFDIGDHIIILDKGARIEGIVEEITLNYTKITGYSGNVTYIPNRTITTETVENKTKSRYHLYVYKIPFKRTETPSFVKEALRAIEERIEGYDPISLEIIPIDPSVQDYIYQIEVKLPIEDKEYEYELQNFLCDYLYRSSRDTLQK